jgi:hypothetical protein
LRAKKTGKSQWYVTSAGHGEKAGFGMITDFDYHFSQHDEVPGRDHGSNSCTSSQD